MVFGFPGPNQGVIYGGVVTWLQDYDFHVSAAGYFINGQFYESPETFITLSAPDGTFNRIDTFILDTTGSVTVLEGTPSGTPSQAPLDPASQLQISLTLVETGTTEPTITTECLYVDNAEWTPTTSNVLRFNPDSTTDPCNGAKAIEATTLTTGNNILLNRGATFQPAGVYTVLTFYIKSKAAWGVNHSISLQWELAGVPVGSPVTIFDGSVGFNYGFESADTAVCQIVSIPIFDFAINQNDIADSLRITATGGTPSTMGFHIDDMCLQDIPLPSPPDTDELIKITGNDTTPGYLFSKLVAGTGIALNILNPGGNETLEIENTLSLVAQNGLNTLVAPDTVELGGDLLHNTIIDTTGAYSLTVQGDVPSGTDVGTLIVRNNYALDANSAALYVSAPNAIAGRFDGSNYGVYATVTGLTGGIGIRGNALASVGATGAGVFGYAEGGSPAIAGTIVNTTNNDVTVMSRFNKSFVGAAADGIGQKTVYSSTTSTGVGQTTHEIVTKWTTADSATRVSQYEIWGVDNAVLDQQFTLKGSGQLQLNNYGVATFTGTPAYGLAVDASGNVIEGPLGGGLGAITADNGLTANTISNVQLGGTLLQYTTIDTTPNFTLTIDGDVPFANGLGTLIVNNDAVFGTAIHAAVLSGTAINAVATSGGGGVFTSSSGTGIQAQSTTNSGALITTGSSGLAAIVAQVADATANAITPGITLYKAPSGAVSNGVGISLDYAIKNSTGSVTMGANAAARWTNSTFGALVSQYKIATMDASVLHDVFTLNGNGSAQLNEYGSGTFTGTPTSFLGVDINGNIIEIDGLDLDIVVDADNGLEVDPANNVRLGGNPLLQDTTIPTSAFNLTIDSSAATSTLEVTNTNAAGIGLNVSTNGVGISVNAGGTGIETISVDELGIYAQSTNYAGISAVSENDLAGYFTINPASTNTAIPILRLIRASSGAGANGIGGYIEFFTKSSVNTNMSNRVKSIWSDATEGTRTSQFVITGVDNAVAADLFVLNGDGSLQLTSYGAGTITAGAATFALATDVNGNIVEIAIGAGMTNPMGAVGDLIYSADGAGTPAALNIGAEGDVLTVTGGLPVWAAPGVGGGGTVTGPVSVVTANGFAGSVSSPTIVPAITISTNQTGLLQGNGTSMSGITNSSTVGQVLRVTGASTYAWGALDLADADAITGDLPFSALTQIAGLSVLGVTGSSTADVAGITAGTDGHVLRRSGSTLTFGTINLASANTVGASILDEVNGGTGQSSFTTGDILYASGSNTLSKLPIGANGFVLTSNGVTMSWAAGGGGTVQSVTGTSNRITISGTPTVAPVVDIAATYVGQTSITTLGTITTGTWNGTGIGATFGGTGQTSWTAGQILYASGVNTLAKLSPGLNGQVLQLVAGLPSWQTLSGAGTVTSVNASGGSTGFNFTGGPITSSGTLVLSGTLNSVSGGTGFNTTAVGDLLQGASANAWQKLSAVATGNVLLSGGVLTASSWGKVGLTTHVTGRLGTTNLFQGTGLSVLGVPGNVTADHSSISAGSDFQILRRSGSAIGFGSINLASANAVGTTILPRANGGTGVVGAANGNLLIGNGGTTWSVGAPTGTLGITAQLGAGTINYRLTVNPTRQAVADSSTITWNLDNGSKFSTTLTNTGRTLAFAGTPVAGETYVFECKQDGTGNRTITTWPATVLWDGGTIPTLSTTGGKKDLFTFYYDGTNYLGKLVGRF